MCLACLQRNARNAPFLVLGQGRLRARSLSAPLDLLVLDCSMPPQERPPRNHNDLTRALECIESLRPRRAVLTHVGHALDAWLLDHPAALPEGVELAHDGMCLPL